MTRIRLEGVVASVTRLPSQPASFTSDTALVKVRRDNSSYSAIVVPRALFLEPGIRVTAVLEGDRLLELVKLSREGARQAFPPWTTVARGRGGSRFWIKEAMLERELKEARAIARSHPEGPAVGMTLVAYEKQRGEAVGVCVIWRAMRECGLRRDLLGLSLKGLRNLGLHRRIAWGRRLFVRGPWRKSGIGSGLARAMVEYANERLFPEPWLVEVLANLPPAKAGFMKRAGFTYQGETLTRKHYYTKFLNEQRLRQAIKVGGEE